MLQHVRCRLKGRITNLVHADRVPAVITCHESAACNVSGRDVHALSLRFNGGQCRGIRTATTDFGHWLRPFALSGSWPASLQGGELFAFAGIWDRWKDPNGKTGRDLHDSDHDRKCDLTGSRSHASHS